MAKKELILKVALKLNKDIASLVESYILIGLVSIENSSTAKI